VQVACQKPDAGLYTKGDKWAGKHRGVARKNQFDLG